MANWKELRQSARRTAQSLKEKNHRAALINRLRLVVSCEERAAEKEYLALGRYYYNALRNRDNAIAESHCARIDSIQKRRDQALSELEKAVSPSAEITTIFSEVDGPTAVFVTARKRGTLLHYSKNSAEITVTRDNQAEYDPEDEDSEEIDLSDVKSFDQDPMPEAATPPAELDENDSLPFE